MTTNENDTSAWEENAHFFYDTLLTHVLEWASLSVEILPTQNCRLNHECEDEQTLSILIGTHTSDDKENSILLLDVFVPKLSESVTRTFSVYDDYAGFGFGTTPTKFSIRCKAQHPCGEPNRLRSMPQNSSVVASISTKGSVMVMNFSQLEVQERDSETLPVTLPSLNLVNHVEEGWALDWNSVKEGRLATGSNDCFICVWDVTSPPFSNKTSFSTCSIDPTLRLTGHTGAVQDVAWQPTLEYLLCSAADDGTFKVWDIRASNRPQIDQTESEGVMAINSIALNKFRTELFATGGENQDIVLWDMRNTSEPLHRMSGGHRSCISRIAWGPSERYVASCGTDSFVLVWDLDSIGKETSGEDDAEGPTELMFSHAGHSNLVYDFSWSPNEDTNMMISSVSQDNELHIWRVDKTILQSDVSDVEDDDDSFIYE